MYQLLYNEFITSTNFSVLFKQALKLFNPNFGLGFYLQGIPTRLGVDFFWGTNSGIRILPLIVWLDSFQRFFGNNWEIVYLLACLVSIPSFFILGISLVKRIDIWVVVGTIFYSFNPWVVTKLFTGTWHQLFAYSLLPLLLFIPKVVNKQNSFKLACLFSLLVSIVIVFNPIYLLFPGVFLILDLLRQLVKKNHTVNHVIYFYTLSVILLIALNIYFLIPSILYPEYQTTFYPGYSLGAIRYNSQNSYLQNVLRLDVWSNMQNTSWSLVDYIQTIPLIFILIVFIRNNKRDWLLLSGLILFIFLSKALHPPGSIVSKWLFENITILRYSRDTSRFLAAVILFGSIIITSYSTKTLLKTSKKIALIIVSLFIMWLSVHQFFINSTNVFLQKTEIPMEYADLAHFIENNLESESRILTVPNNLSISSYRWFKGNNPPSPRTLFGGILPLKTPIVDSSYYPDNYSNQISAFLYNKFLASGDADYLKPMGVKYLLIDNNITKVLDLPTVEGKLIFGSDNLKLFDLLSNQRPELIDTKDPTFVIGDFNSIAKRSNNYPVILLNQPNNINLLLNGTLDNIQIESDFNNPELTLTGEGLTDKYSVKLFEVSKNQDKVFIPYEPYNLAVIEKYGALFTNSKPVVSNGLGSLDVTHKLIPGKYKILIKGILLGKQSHLTLRIEKVVRDIYLNDTNSLVWRDLGTVDVGSQVDSINISSFTPDSVGIDHLLIVPENDFYSKMRDVKAILAKNTANYNNNKYLTYLVSFGKYWDANNSQFKLISNGFAMTFVGKNEEIGAPTYYPEIGYKISLLISGISFISIAFCLLVSLFNKLKLFFMAMFQRY